MNKTIITSILTSGMALLLQTQVSFAFEDRDATPEERTKVMDALEADGCIYADDVDFEGSFFKADDVVCQDGKKYDVILDLNYKVTSKSEEFDD